MLFFHDYFFFNFLQLQIALLFNGIQHMSLVCCFSPGCWWL